jgi:hypothetical protein
LLPSLVTATTLIRVDPGELVPKCIRELLRERTGEPLGKIPFRRTPDFDEIQVFLGERQRVLMWSIISVQLRSIASRSPA